MKRIAVIGAGSWGTTLAQLLNDNGHKVVLWVRNPEKANKIAKTRYNDEYLKQLRLDDNIVITSDLKQAAIDADIVLIVVPSHGMADLCCQLSGITSLAGKVLVSCTKGFEYHSGMRMSEIIQGYFPKTTVAVLSGPNHAEEIALRQPSATVIACQNAVVANELQNIFLNDYFRPYITDDILGVEIAGSLKNVIALTSGIMFGLGFGDNSQAALITRGLTEITRLGVKMGAQQQTFSGLAGVGDLIATCTSKHSRNRRAGEALARGKTFNEICSETNMVIEGINATTSAHMLAQRYSVEMPITNSIYQILYENKNPLAALQELMRRSGKREYII
ncbi:MAG: NAD(P)H-dependent glycerol-3-phosphate dehydrogenase [Acidaminococcaceae bacterium]